MSIRAILPIAKTRLVTITCTAPVFDAAKLLSAKRTNLVVVCNADGTMAGVVSKTDVVRQVSTCTGCSGTTIVSDIMTRKVITCHLEDELIDVWTTMKNNVLKQIPINDHELRPIGLLNANDALQLLLKGTDNENLFLRDYVMGIGYN